MLHMNKTFSPLSKPARVSVPIAPEVHAVFKRLSDATGRSLGSVVAEWLADTSQSAALVAEKFEQVRGSTRLVSAELHAYALGMADESGEVIRRVKAAAVEGTRGRGVAAAAAVPPSCNTGGKVPKTPNASKGGNSGSKLIPKAPK